MLINPDGLALWSIVVAVIAYAIGYCAGHLSARSHPQEGCDER